MRSDAGGHGVAECTVNASQCATAMSTYSVAMSIEVQRRFSLSPHR